MSNVAIRVERISKRYPLGEVAGSSIVRCATFWRARWKCRRGGFAREAARPARLRPLRSGRLKMSTLKSSRDRSSA